MIKKTVSLLLLAALLFTTNFTCNIKKNISASSYSELNQYLQKTMHWTHSGVFSGSDYSTLQGQVELKFYAKNANSGSAGSPTVIYVMNHGMERIGTESDVEIINNFLNGSQDEDLGEDFIVITADYSQVQDAVSPALDWNLQALRNAIYSNTNNSIFADTTLKISNLELYVVPAGCRLARNLTFWDISQHGVDGSLGYILQQYNDPTYLVQQAGMPIADTWQDMKKKNGEPMDFTQKLDIVYPSQPNKTAPVFMLRNSSHMRRMAEENIRRPHYLGFMLRGYAYVIYDFNYTPIARADHYEYTDRSYSMDGVNGYKSIRAALRLVKDKAYKYGYSDKLIGAWGHSKGSMGPACLIDPDNAEKPERDNVLTYSNTYGNGSGDAPNQPWLTYSDGPKVGQPIPTDISVAYMSMGDGTRFYKSIITGDYGPFIIACGENDKDHTQYWNAQTQYYLDKNLNHMALWMKSVGHDFPYGYDAELDIDRYLACFDYFEQHLTSDIAPKPIYTLPIDKDVNVSRDSSVTIKFSVPMNVQSVKSGTNITKSDGTLANGSWNVSLQDTTFTWIPEGRLLQGEKYEISINTTTENQQNIPVTEKILSEFTTVNASQVLSIRKGYENVIADLKNDTVMLGDGATVEALKEALYTDGSFLVFDDGTKQMQADNNKLVSEDMVIEVTDEFGEIYNYLIEIIEREPLYLITGAETGWANGSGTNTNDMYERLISSVDDAECQDGKALEFTFTRRSNRNSIGHLQFWSPFNADMGNLLVSGIYNRLELRIKSTAPININDEHATETYSSAVVLGSYSDSSNASNATRTTHGQLIKFANGGAVRCGDTSNSSSTSANGAVEGLTHEYDKWYTVFVDFDTSELISKGVRLITTILDEDTGDKYVSSQYILSENMDAPLFNAIKLDAYTPNVNEMGTLGDRFSVYIDYIKTYKWNPFMLEIIDPFVVKNLAVDSILVEKAITVGELRSALHSDGVITVFSSKEKTNVVDDNAAVTANMVLEVKDEDTNETHDYEIMIAPEVSNFDMIVSENIVLRSNNSAYGTPNQLRVKSIPNATESVILLKFDYNGVDPSDIDNVYLDLYSIFVVGTGRDNPNRARLYWTSDISWNEETTAWSALPASLTEVGDNIINVPYLDIGSPETNKYYSFNVTDAILAHDAVNSEKVITFVLRQDRTQNSNGGLEFHARTNTNPPKLIFSKSPKPEEISVLKRYGISDSKVAFTCVGFTPNTDTFKNIVINNISNPADETQIDAVASYNGDTVTVAMNGLKGAGVYEIDMSEVFSTTGSPLPSIIFTTNSTLTYTVDFSKDLTDTVTAVPLFKYGSEKFLIKNKPEMVIGKYQNKRLSGIETKIVNTPIWFYDDANYDSIPTLSASGWSTISGNMELVDAPDGIPGEPNNSNRGYRPKMTGNYTMNTLEPVDVSKANSYVEGWFYDDDPTVPRNGGLWVRTIDDNIQIHITLRDSASAISIHVGNSRVATVPRTKGWNKFAFDFTSGNGFRALVNGEQIYPTSGLDENYTGINRFQIGVNGWSNERLIFDRIMASTELPLDYQYNPTNPNAVIPTGAFADNIAIENVGEFENVRLFMWDSLSDMKPFSGVFNYQVNGEN
ncbi:MAG: DNRLRE domain-containing protein [Firmicutes bacterium]|nr:DNRLRE domain-containing protein [Bacillota bacterium]